MSLANRPSAAGIGKKRLHIVHRARLFGMPADDEADLPLSEELTSEAEEIEISGGVKLTLGDLVDSNPDGAFNDTMRERPHPSEIDLQPEGDEEIERLVEWVEETHPQEIVGEGLEKIEAGVDGRCGPRGDAGHGSDDGESDESDEEAEGRQELRVSPPPSPSAPGTLECGRQRRRRRRRPICRRRRRRCVGPPSPPLAAAANPGAGCLVDG